MTRTKDLRCALSFSKFLTHFLEAHFPYVKLSITKSLYRVVSAESKLPRVTSILQGPGKGVADNGTPGGALDRSSNFFSRVSISCLSIIWLCLRPSLTDISCSTFLFAVSSSFLRPLTDLSKSSFPFSFWSIWRAPPPSCYRRGRACRRPRKLCSKCGPAA